MQFGNIGAKRRYDRNRAAFQKAFAFLQGDGLAELPEKWIDLGDGVRASVQHYTTMPAETLSFETHERFFDIQYLVEGEEYVGCVSREGLEIEVPYCAEQDIAFYHEPELSGKVLLRAGDFVVLSPEDAHKPRCAAGKPMAVKKIVIKVPV